MAEGKQNTDGPGHPDLDRNVIIYDGECPFCSRYVQLVRLRDAIGAVQLIDARQGGADVADAIAKGYDLNEGMLLRLNNTYYHGSDCMNRLALLSSDSGLSNRLVAAIFRSPGLSRVLYPFLRFGRNTVLAILGRKKLTTD